MDIGQINLIEKPWQISNETANFCQLALIELFAPEQEIVRQIGYEGTGYHPK
jgi:hypothetical protein